MQSATKGPSRICDQVSIALMRQFMCPYLVQMQWLCSAMSVMIMIANEQGKGGNSAYAYAYHHQLQTGG